MSDIYLSITETPTVVTLTNPLISSNVAQSVTVTNVVSVNVVTMPAITVQAAAPAVTTVAGTVSISNFPATQTIAGTVTANVLAVDQNALQSALDQYAGNYSDGWPVKYSDGNNFPISGTVTANVPLIRDEVSNNSSVVYPISGADVNAIRAVLYSGYDFGSDQGAPVDGLNPLYVQGTVTANMFGFDCVNNEYSPIPVLPYNEPIDCGNTVIARLTDTSGTDLNLANGVPISGTVTATVASTTVTVSALPSLAAGTAQIGSVTASISGTVPVSISSVTIGNTVTVNQASAITIGANPSGALTTRFGSVTTANTAQITSAVTNTSRKYLLAQNISAGTVTIGIGFSPTTTQGIQLTAGAGLTFDAFCPTGAVYWLGAVTGAAFTILEG